MHVGDRVRFLHSKDEGIVKRIIDSQQVEVEIEDGFDIPALKKELVLVSEKESSYFSREEISHDKVAEKVTSGVGTTGLYLALFETDQTYCEWYLINNTDLSVAFSAGKETGDRYQGYLSGQIAAKSYHLMEKLDIRRHRDWPIYQLDMIFHYDGLYKRKPPLNVQIHFKKSDIFRQKTEAPVLGKKAYVLSVDKPEKGNLKISKPDARQLKEAMTEGRSQKERNQPVVAQTLGEVDLHWDSLPEHWKNEPHLKSQIDFFEFMLDQCLLQGVDETVFIHGVGNGALRDAIQRQLSQMQQVSYFEDARKEKFGFGATRVVFK